MKIAKVILDKASPAYDRPYDYIVPEALTHAQAGCRVSVSFGAGNRSRVGWILDVCEAANTDVSRCKPIQALIDETPLLDGEALYLLHVLHETTFCTWGDAAHALVVPGAGVTMKTGLRAVVGDTDIPDTLSSEAKALYAHLRGKSSAVLQEKALAALGLAAGHACVAELAAQGLVERSQLVRRRVADERAVMARLAQGPVPQKLTAKQRAVADLLESVGCASVRELCYFCGVTRAVVERMRKQGLVELFEEIVARKPAQPAAAVTDTSPIVLTGAQQAAYDSLAAVSDTKKFETSLLWGVTGSGKTQVFLRLIEKTLAAGRRAMVLIPEISLTPQTAELFCSRFGSRVAVLHSSLSMTQRLDEWQRIREGKADIVVGTRSAVFAPLSDIGLIVIDEEQESTYHSERSPRYHARDVARVRAARHGAHLLLCSATPSVETYYQAQNGRCHLVELRGRYSGDALPEVVLVDMRSAPLAADSTVVSQALAEEIEKNLSSGEQSVLLLNRRGYHTLMKCSACQQVAACPNCSIALTYHAANGRMVCHYCGFSHAQYQTCPSCESRMIRYSGAGTQRAQEELQALFPKARILRMDTDTTMNRWAHQKGFEAFARGEYDILIGTQMVAKGHNFPLVTLVGVLNADQSLYTEDFRGFERTFSLLTQVVGRSGRSGLPGRAYIQTFSSEHRIFPLAAAQDYPAFYEEEIEFRRVGLYPPFCDIVCVWFLHEEEKPAAEGARVFAEAFVRLARERYADLPVRLLGPAPANPYRVAGRWRVHALIKCKNNRRTRELLAQAAEAYYSQPQKAAMSIDMYYDR